MNEILWQAYTLVAFSLKKHIQPFYGFSWMDFPSKLLRFPIKIHRKNTREHTNTLIIPFIRFSYSLPAWENVKQSMMFNFSHSLIAIRCNNTSWYISIESKIECMNTDTYLFLHNKKKTFPPNSYQLNSFLLCHTKF